MSTQQKNTVSEACERARQAFSALGGLAPEARAGVLDAVAAALDARRDEILRTCSEETALTIEELNPEFARMTGTLRMFAELVREGSWVRAAVDVRVSQSPGGYAGLGLPAIQEPGVTAGALLVGPNHDIRSMLVPLGPVAVFGSSNFPLAYGVCGGDTASALAAGCPVIVKEHPAHPKTGRLLAGIAQEATRAVGFDGQLVGYVPNEDPRDYSVAAALVGHFVIAGVGFTGSTGGGLALEKLARERSEPIPVFAEMGSNNVVVVTERAAKTRPEGIADEIAASLLQRFGQQCTCPGTIIVDPGDAGVRLVELLAARVKASSGRNMLAPWIKQSYERRVEEAVALPGVRRIAQGEVAAGAQGAAACLLEVNAGCRAIEMFKQRELREEIFGPAAVVVHLPIDMIGDLGLLRTLTFSMYAESEEMATDWTAMACCSIANAHSGRVIFNGVPTGVRVATSMVHGGPFPATNVPHTTAVGPRAIERWSRPVCWQNCPGALLPEELRDENPRGVMRVVNGVWTRDGVARPG